MVLFLIYNRDGFRFTKSNKHNKVTLSKTILIRINVGSVIPWDFSKKLSINDAVLDLL